MKIDDRTSESFLIENGTRQGCSLSPLIFILTIEPFLRKIRANVNIKGIKIKEEEQKLAAYADNLIFFVTSPIISIPSLLMELSEYGKISNFKVNYGKSKAMGIEIKEPLLQLVTTQFEFRWTNSYISYLGMKISKNLKELFEPNYIPMAKQIKLDLSRWDKEIFTWFGRTNIIKMNVMPRLLYLIQTLPIKIPPSFLRDLRSRFLKCIWVGKPARVHRTILSLPKGKGGIGLPDPIRYQEASHLTRVMEWCGLQQDHTFFKGQSFIIKKRN